jgi:hypothetical protein
MGLQRKGLPITVPAMPRYGTVDWLFREFKLTKAYLEKVAPGSKLRMGDARGVRYQDEKW